MTELPLHEILNNADPLNLISVETAVQKAHRTSLDDFISVPVFFLSNFTVSGIEPFVEYFGLRSKLNTEVGFGDYNVIHQALMQENSTLHTHNPKVVVISLMYDVIAQTDDVDVCSELQDLFTLAAKRFHGAIILNTFVAPAVRDISSSPTPSKFTKIQLANDFIRQFVKDNSSQFFLCDWEQYVQAFGYHETIDRRYWFMAKAPFKPPFLSCYAADIAKICRAISGLSKKCLLLDCDGTLWGGVLGEEGIDGVHLHPDDYPGNVFYDVQRKIIELQQRGVLLAIISKNNELDVLNFIENHPHCLLAREHLSAYRVNWLNKAENIADISTELNLGLDSFVFLDDSDFECDLVNERLPAVEVRQVPKRLYEYPDIVAALADDLFFTTNQTNEDAARADLYSARQKAEVSKAEFNDIETYLASLDITADIHQMQVEEIPRVAQLTQKTNQFNLAKTVYSQADITNFHDDAEHTVYVMLVNDRFGKLGLTNVCIVLQLENGKASIDTFLMSCRVFERNLEYAFLDYVITDLMRTGSCGAVCARYRRTPKNVVAEMFYEKMGFRLKNNNDLEKSYALDAKDYEPKTYNYIRRI